MNNTSEASDFSSHVRHNRAAPVSPPTRARPMVISLGAALAAVLLLAPLDARAQVAAETAGAHLHDGFYLRFNMGPSALGMERAGTVMGGAGSPIYTGNSRIEGGAFATELSIGGALRPGLNLAGTYLGHQIAKPQVDHMDGTTSALDGPLQFGLIGMSIDYYPDPSGGFHFGATLGLAYAFAKIPQPSWFEYLGGAGGGASIAVGYDWWIGRNWSLGVLGRATAARIRGEGTQLNVTASEDDTLTAGALMLAVCYQ